MGALNMMRAAKVCALLQGNLSIREIHRQTGCAVNTIRQAAAVLTDNGISLPSRSRLLSEQDKAQISALFTSTPLSDRQIAKEVGVSYSIVSIYRRKHDAKILAEGGTLPLCACGQRLHHPRLCAARMKKRFREQGLNSRLFLDEDDQQTLKKRVLAGESCGRVGADLGLSKGIVQHLVESLPQAEREQRSKAIREARAARRARIKVLRRDAPSATIPSRDPLYAAIQDLVPRIEPALRKDIVSETFLYVLEGGCSARNLAEAVQRASKRMYALHGWRYIRSLDAPDRFGRPMIDSLAAPEDEPCDGGEDDCE